MNTAQRVRTSAGFTIVELLVVVVVVGILAVIVIVGYGAVQRDAVITALKSDLRNAADMLKVSTTNDDGRYPATMEEADDGNGLKSSQGVTFQYTYNPVDNSYCLSATSSMPGVPAFHVSSANNDKIEEGLCDGHVIPVQFTPNQGIVTTFAGTGTSGWLDGAKASAQFYRPAAIAADSTGNLYIAEYGNHRIRKISTDGNVSTFAGSGTAGSANGVGTAAQFNMPRGIAIDSSDNLYVSDYSNQRIRKITPDGVVTNFATSIASPRGIVIDSQGNLFVASFGLAIIRKVTPSGTVSVFAGSSGVAGSADGTGADARFQGPAGLAIDEDDNIYVADSNNHLIRKITPSAVVTTIAGVAGVTGSQNGPALSATFYFPASIGIDAQGSLYVGSQNMIRKISTDMVVSTLAGATTEGYVDGTGTNARFRGSSGIYINDAGTMFIPDFDNHRIRKIE